MLLAKRLCIKRARNEDVKIPPKISFVGFNFSKENTNSINPTKPVVDKMNNIEESNP